MGRGGESVTPSESIAGGRQHFVQQQRSPERDNQIFSKTLHLQEPKPKEGQAKSAPVKVGSEDSCKDLKLVASGTRREALEPLANLLLKRYSALIAGEGLGALCSEASELAESDYCSSNQEKVASDSSVHWGKFV